MLLRTLIGVIAPIVWLAYPFLTHFGGPPSAAKLRESARSLVPPTARVTRISDLQCGFDSPMSCVSVHSQTPGRLEQGESAALALARFKGWRIVKHVPAVGGASDFVKLGRERDHSRGRCVGHQDRRPAAARAAVLKGEKGCGGVRVEGPDSAHPLSFT
jgi:hypothetical protein